MSRKNPAKYAILERLTKSNKLLAIHEFNLHGYSENAIGTRLPELAKLNFVYGQKRIGQSYKEWGITKDGIEYLTNHLKGDKNKNIIYMAIRLLFPPIPRIKKS